MGQVSTRAEGGQPPPGDAATTWWGDLASVSPDLLLAIRMDATILAANAAWRRMLGHDPVALVGTDQRDLVHPDDRRIAYDVLHGLAPGEARDFAQRVRHADGRWRSIWWMSTMDESGTIVHAAGRDITDQRAAYDLAVQHHDRLSEAERVGRMGSFAWQPGGQLVVASPELRRIVGLDGDSDEITVDQYLAVVDPDDRARLVEALDTAVRTGESFQIEYRITRSGGPPRIVRGHAGIVRGGDGHVRLVGTVRDVTEQRRMEAGLRRALEAEQSVVQQLERLDRVKSAFLRAVSHELRTPATVVRGMADTLVRLRGSAPEETIDRLQQALAANAVKLSDLLEDLLDVDRLGQGVTTPGRSELDVAMLVRVMLDSHRGRAVRYEGPDELTARLDRVQFERIVVNLLDNARKYAPHGEVLVRLAARADRGVRLDVIDEGPGIPDSERQHVFEPFHRLDAEDHRPGTGIGLSLVAAFAEAHGGAAWAEPSESGAHIVVVVPGPNGVEMADDRI